MRVRRFWYGSIVAGGAATVLACSNPAGTSASKAALGVDDDTIFELEGDAVDETGSGAPTGDDWSTVNATGGSSFVHTGVLADPAPQSIFTGGRKDIQVIADWSHKSGAVPDKDDITNAYAAAYNVSGDLVVYFGADRIANEGDAQLGFWFFQQQVGAEPDGSFSGEHTNHDLLVLVNFSNGGTVPTIQVLEWVGSGGDQQGGTLNLLYDAAAATCNPAVNQTVCAVTNATDATAPWPYVPKGGSLGDPFPPVAFFEGGINISALFPESTPCFASFMAETRSSTSVTASLKDFVLGAFPVCKITVVKLCTSGSVNADESGFVFSYEGTVTNDGFGTVYDVTVTDDGDGDVFNLGSLGGGLSAPFSGTFESALNPASNTATATAALAPGGPVAVTDSSDLAVCPEVDRNPAISVSKTCDVGLELINGVVVLVVDYTGQVCNDTSGAGAIGLENVTVTDDAGTPADPTDDTVHSIGELAAGECKPYNGSYVPGALPTAGNYSDTVTARGTAKLGFGDVEETASATCAVCP